VALGARDGVWGGAEEAERGGQGSHGQSSQEQVSWSDQTQRARPGQPGIGKDTDRQPTTPKQDFDFGALLDTQSTKFRMDRATTASSAGGVGFDRHECENVSADPQPPPIHPIRSNDQSDEPMDALAMLCQQYCSDNNVEVRFDPNARVLNPNACE